MTSLILADASSRLLWLVLILSLPVILATSLVSLALAVIQAVMQIQDQTLQFLIKLLVASAVLALTYRWMGENLIRYLEHALDQIGRRT
jgi:type III secretion protein S